MQANMEKSACASNAGNFLVPHLKGLVEPVTPCVYTKCSVFFLAFSLGPQDGTICVATSDFVPMLGTPEGRGYVATTDFFPLLGTPEKPRVT